jgi:hypothetical protein
MPTISDLFKNQKKELYGKSDTIRIDSRGLINPPRGAALLLSSPNSLGDLIGNQIAGAVGGSANRPSDTIFKNNSFLAKPISLFKTPSDLRNAVDAKENYFVKQSPAGASILGKIKQGASNPLGTLAEVGIDLLKGLKDKNPTKGAPYGQKYQTTINGKTLTETKTFSEFYQEYTARNNPITGQMEYIGGDVIKRDTLPSNAKWDNENNSVNQTDSYKKDEKLNIEKNNELANQVWVLFKKLGNNETIPFAGTISGISEDVTPEWTNFKYLGSPFKTYRYQGVERTLTFNLQLYYTTILQKGKMIKKINYLKSLAFPYEHIAQFTYKDEKGTATGPSSQYAFSPNLFYLTIGDMYKNMFGFIETLSFTVDDNTTWPNDNHNMGKYGDNSLYPSVVSVSITMKIIENHATTQDKGITRYKYNFDGLDMNIAETEELTQKKSDPLKPLETGQDTKKDEPPTLTKTNKPTSNVVKTNTIDKNGLDHSKFPKDRTITDTIYGMQKKIRNGISVKNLITSGK